MNGRWVRLLLILLIGLAGCGFGNDAPADTSPPDPVAAPDGGNTATPSPAANSSDTAANSSDTAANSSGDTTIRIARATWNTGWFQTAIYAQLLEELGYTVEPAETLTIDVFYEAVARGDVDLWVNGWFPQHTRLVAKEAPRVELLGSQMRGSALQGYLIDKTTADETGIRNLSDLQDPANAALFDRDGNGKADLVGCNTDWQCARIIDHHLAEYALTDTVEHVQGEYDQLMLETRERLASGEPVLFYTWTPNWPLAELVPGSEAQWLEVPFSTFPEELTTDPDLTFVPDLEGCASNPCNIGWPINDIRVVGNAAFLSANPQARRLLELVAIPLEDVAAQNSVMFFGENSDADIKRQAADWIAANRQPVDQWLAEARTWEEQPTLARVQARGELLCGIQRNVPGFGVVADGNASGFNADMCRAVATAALGDANAVTFVPLTEAERFAAVDDRRIDVLFHNASWSALRDLGMNPPNSGIRVAFGPTIFYDGQRFMVPTDAGITELNDLADGTICVLAGSAAEQNLNDQFANRGIAFTLQRFDDSEALYDTYERGGCDAITSDTSELAGRQSRFTSPDEHVILEEPISREPHSPVYREGDMQWADVVNWAVFSTIYAEELGVDTSNVDSRLEEGNPDVDHLLGVRGNIGGRLGLADTFALDIIRSVGNYREIYLRNIDTAILPRGPNKTWNSEEGPGGLLSSPPFR